MLAETCESVVEVVQSYTYFVLTSDQEGRQWLQSVVADALEVLRLNREALSAGTDSAALKPQMVKVKVLVKQLSSCHMFFS